MIEYTLIHYHCHITLITDTNHFHITLVLSHTGNFARIWIIDPRFTHGHRRSTHRQTRHRMRWPA